MSIRTTLTLDEDLVVALKDQSRAMGVPFRKLLNDVLRRGFQSMKSAKKSQPFTIEPIELELRPGLSYDNIHELLDYAEGIDRR